MNSIRNTETLTKFLRSKNGSLPEIIQVARDVLDSKLGFEMPDAPLFILDLICDRVGDHNKFKDWKMHTDVWLLFNRVWTMIKDKSVKERVIRKLNLLDTLTKVLNQFFEISDQNAFFTALLQSTTIINQNCSIQGDEAACTTLLAAFTNIFETDLDDDLLIKWTHMAKALFSICANEIDYTPSKKHLSRFFKTCLPKLLSCAQNMDSSLAPCSRDISDLIVGTILGKHQTPVLLPNTQEMMKQEVPPTSMYLFFKMIVSSIGNKQPKVVEDVYLVITEVPRYNNISESLIEVLANLNKPLSTEFFESVYSGEIKSSEVNWKLIGYIITLDATLAMEKATEITAVLNKQRPETILQFLPDLIKAYVSARELFEFITTAWQNNILDNATWAGAEVVDLVAQYIDDLSSAQLNKVIQHIIDQESISEAITVAVAKGLVKCSSEKVSAVQEVAFKGERFYNQDSFEAKFYLLMCYPEEVNKFTTMPVKSQPDQFYFFTVFRVAEVTGKLDIIDGQVLHAFTKFIKTQHSEQVFKTLLQRWCVMINATFDNSSIQQFLEACIGQLNIEYWTDFLQTADVFYEQTKLIGCLLKTLLASGDADLIQLIQNFPQQTIPRSIRVEATNKAVELRCTNTLKHLLLQPTFKSTIETDLDVLVNLIDDKDYEQILILVWNNYLKQAKSDNSFVSSSLERFSKTLKESKSLTNETRACSLVVSETNSSMLPKEVQDQLASLRSKLFKKLTKLISRDLERPLELKQELRILERLLEKDTKDFSLVTVKQIGSATKELKDDEINVLLFKVYTKIADFSAYKHIISLYFLLFKATELEDCLVQYFIKIAEDPYFDEVIIFVLESMTASIDSSSGGIYVSLIGCIMKTLKKETKGEQKLGIIISIILNRLDIIAARSEALISLLTLLKSSLTDINWCFNQYSIESVINLVTKVAWRIADSDEEITGEHTYVCCTQVISQILLFHRFRLNSRHHSVIDVFVALLKPLTLKSSLSSSVICSASYSRLLSNLCEPSNSAKRVVNDRLTTASSLIKKNLRKYLPVLLVNYISLSLTENFSRTNNDELIKGIFNIFDVLSQRELETTNELLGSQGVIAYKALYSDYKSHGKWKDS